MKEALSQLYITHFWKDHSPHELSEKIIYEYNDPTNPIPPLAALAILKEVQHGSIETMKERSLKRFIEKNKNLPSKNSDFFNFNER